MITSFATTLEDDWVNDPNDLRTSKAFAYFLASGVPGRKRGSKPSLSSVLQVWKNPSAGWPFDNRGDIFPGTKTTLRNVSYALLLLDRVLRLLSIVYPRRGDRIRRFAVVPALVL